MTATFASVIKAWDGSVMRPVTDAFVDWARRTHACASRKRKAHTATARIGNLWANDVKSVSLLACGPLVNTQKSDLLLPSSGDAGDPGRKVKQTRIIMR